MSKPPPFIPRSVVQKPKLFKAKLHSSSITVSQQQPVQQKTVKQQQQHQHNADTRTVNPKQHVDIIQSTVVDQASNVDDDKVKEYNLEQRWPSSDEPVCIICGKYGEYICDETDEDVCSLQCKATHLKTYRSLNNESKYSTNIHQEGAPNTFHLSQHQPERVSFLLQQDVPTPSGVGTSCCMRNDISPFESTADSFDVYYTTKTTNNKKQQQTSHTITPEKLKFFREKLKIRIKGDTATTSIPNMLFSFQNASLPFKLCENLKEHQYVNPTPVQMQVIPIANHGSDVLVSAPTGSGKTAAFIIPIIQRIQSLLGDLPPSHEFCKHPIALVLAPTRELCIQIEEQAKQLSKSIKNFKTALLIGGNPLPQQIHRLKHKIQLIIGTPGRLNDIIDNYSSVLQLHQMKMVVLDEVDVMLNMGFQSQIQLILSGLFTKPQYLMFSATIPPIVERMVEKMLIKPVFVSVGLSGLPNNKINQLILWVEDISKKKKLFSIIEDGRHFLPPVVVFVESKIGADMLCEALSNKFRLHCESMHSEKQQSDRTDVLQKFLGGAYDILVATNIMARGIDLINVKQVIVFDMPKSLDEYVHQIGRAGRLENIGFSIAFLNNSSKYLFYELREQCKLTGCKLPDEIVNSPYLRLEQDKKIKDKKEGKMKRKEWENEEVNPQSLLEILTKRRK